MSNIHDTQNGKETFRQAAARLRMEPARSLGDWLMLADWLLVAILDTDLAPRAQQADAIVWRTGDLLTTAAETGRLSHEMRALGYVLCFRAVLTDPTLPQAILERVSARIIDAAPSIRAMLPGTMPPPPPQAPLVHGRGAAEIERLDTLTWVSGVINAMVNMEVDNDMEPDEAALWEGGIQLHKDNRHGIDAPIGAVMMLDALIASPAAVQRALEGLRGALVTTDPRLDAFLEQTAA